jgi:hypothetical protein
VPLTAFLLYLAGPQSPGLSGGQEIFFQYGPVGVLAAGGLWFGFRVYNREAARADREAQAKADLMEKVIPLMTDAVRVLSDATAILRDQQRGGRE